MRVIALLKKIQGNPTASKLSLSSHARQNLPGTSGRRALHAGTSTAAQVSSNVQSHSGNKRQLEPSALDRPDKHKQHRTGENGMNKYKKNFSRKHFKEASPKGECSVTLLSDEGLTHPRIAKAVPYLCFWCRWSK